MLPALDMDVDTEFFKNRGVDMDMAWNRWPSNSAREYSELQSIIRGQ